VGKGAKWGNAQIRFRGGGTLERIPAHKVGVGTKEDKGMSGRIKDVLKHHGEHGEKGKGERGVEENLRKIK